MKSSESPKQGPIKAPNSKIQAPEKHQDPSTRRPFAAFDPSASEARHRGRKVADFGALNLELPWPRSAKARSDGGSLGLGAWSFSGAWMLMLGVFLASCSVGPNYHPPKVALSGEWSEPLEGGMTNRATRAAEWWTTFNDPKLNSLIVRAVQSNYDLRIAEARLRQARAQRRFSTADFWPTMDASASYTRERASKNVNQPGNPFENN